MNTLASIAFNLRFGNLTEDEDAQLAPFNYGNIPQPVKTEQRTARRFGRGEQPTYTETVEHFADGSSFARAS